MMSIISQFTLFCNKILENNNIFKKVFWSLFFFCFSLSSFFLGRISKIFESVPETSLEFLEKSKQTTSSNVVNAPSLPTGEESATSINTKNIVNKNGFTIVASRKGKKYYFLWCTASQNIKPQNRIYFKTEADAKRNGRTLAGSCK